MLLLVGTAVVQVVELMGGLPGLFGTELRPHCVGQAGAVPCLAGRLPRSIGWCLPSALRAGARPRRGGTCALSIWSRWHWERQSSSRLASLRRQRPERTSSRYGRSHGARASPRCTDPGLRPELILALFATGIAIAVAIVGVIWRGIRWYTLGLGVGDSGSGDPATRSAVYRGVSDELLHVAYGICRYRYRAWLPSCSPRIALRATARRDTAIDRRPGRCRCSQRI